MRLHPFITVSSFVLSTLTLTRGDPISCLAASPTLEELVGCLVTFTVPARYYTPENKKYCLTQPRPSELEAWKGAVSRLLDVNADCPNPGVDVTGLESIYTLSLFTERAGDRKSFCVLSEKFTDTSSSTVFARGWGFAIVPAAPPSVARSIHFSAPHPVYDGETPLQAAVLFKRTGAKSLIVTGRHRLAFPYNTDCSQPDDSCDVFYRTDPAHDDNEPFHAALVAVRNWQNLAGGCSAATCAYIQMHRKSVNSCTNYDVFLSSGLENSRLSEAWYSDTVHPVRRLKNALDIHLPPAAGVTHGLPTEFGSCDLTATKNIFGRLVNGRATNFCTSDADRAAVTGEFVHIEQANNMIGSTNYNGWVQAITATFPPV